MRPTFSQIAIELNFMDGGGAASSLMDAMMASRENQRKESALLRNVVRALSLSSVLRCECLPHRPRLLLSNRLLLRFHPLPLPQFPPHVAEALKEGRAVEPESHDCVTVRAACPRPPP